MLILKLPLRTSRVQPCTHSQNIERKAMNPTKVAQNEQALSELVYKTGTNVHFCSEGNGDEGDYFHIKMGSLLMQTSI